MKNAFYAIGVSVLVIVLFSSCSAQDENTLEGKYFMHMRYLVDGRETGDYDDVIFDFKKNGEVILYMPSNEKDLYELETELKSRYKLSGSKMIFTTEYKHRPFGAGTIEWTANYFIHGDTIITTDRQSSYNFPDTTEINRLRRYSAEMSKIQMLFVRVKDDKYRIKGDNSIKEKKPSNSDEAYFSASKKFMEEKITRQSKGKVSLVSFSKISSKLQGANLCVVNFQMTVQTLSDGYVCYDPFNGGSTFKGTMEGFNFHYYSSSDECMSGEPKLIKKGQLLTSPVKQHFDLLNKVGCQQKNEINLLSDLLEVDFHEWFYSVR